VHSLGKLFTGENAVVTDRFKGGASEIFARDERGVRDDPGVQQRTRGGQESSRFCRFAPFDYFFHIITHDGCVPID
jgi:hypothetical protein